MNNDLSHQNCSRAVAKVLKPTAFKGPWCWGCGGKLDMSADELKGHKAVDGKHYCDYSCKPENVAWAQS